MAEWINITLPDGYVFMLSLECGKRHISVVYTILIQLNILTNIHYFELSTTVYGRKARLTKSAKRELAALRQPQPGQVLLGAFCKRLKEACKNT